MAIDSSPALSFPSGGGWAEIREAPTSAIERERVGTPGLNRVRTSGRRTASTFSPGWRVAIVDELHQLLS